MSDLIQRSVNKQKHIKGASVLKRQYKIHVVHLDKGIINMYDSEHA